MTVRELVENSFPCEEPILVREAGRLRMASIGEVCEAELKSGPDLEADGRSYKKVRHPLEVLTLDQDLKLAFRRVTAVFRHPAPPKLWKIRLQSGREVVTTSAHNVFTLGDDLGIGLKETKSLQHTDRIIVPVGRFMPGRLMEIDLLDELEHLDDSDLSRIVVRGAASLYRPSSPSSEVLLTTLGAGTFTRSEIHAAAFNLGFSKPDNLLHTLRRKGSLLDAGEGRYMVDETKAFKRTYAIHRDWVYCDAVPLKFLLTETPSNFGSGSIRFSIKQGRGSISRKIQVTPEFMRVLGYYASEGSTHAHYKVTFSFGWHERGTYVKDLAYCLRESFGIEPIITRQHGSALNVVVNASLFALLIEKVLKCGSNSSDKRIPWVVFNVKQELAEEYLKAYVRGDGHVQVAKRNRKITLATSSPGLFTDLKFLLTLMGRQYTCGLQKGADRMVKGRQTHFGPSYLIYVRQGIAPQAASVPISKFRDELKRHTRATNLYRASVQKDWLRKNFDSEQLPSQLRAFLSSDAGAIPVKDLGRVDSQGQWVYDIAVEGVERFIGGGAVALLHNSMDACELAGIPPDVYVRMISEDINPDVPDPKPYRLSIVDNGPGVPPQHVPSAFGKVFYGSKYVLRQSRGMFGLGGTMAILYGQITSNKPVTISTSADGKRKYTFQMMIDIGENRPVILRRFAADANGFTGTRVDLTLEGDYLRASQKIADYFKQTALVASYANITFVDPQGQATFYERVTTAMPPAPKETLPHPHGIDVEAFKRTVKFSEQHDMKSFMVTHFHRVGDRIATKFLEFAGVSPRLPPKRLSNLQIVALVDALQRFPDFLAPDAACLSPVGEEILLAGISKELQPEFSTVVARPPSSYSGFPFLVEVGVAYGGKVLQPGQKLFRYANRIPLLYDESSDISFKVLNEEVDWRRYHVPQDAPVAVITHICSTKIPYKTVGKEYIADRPEIEREIRNAAREALRKLGLHLSKKSSMEAVQRKMNIYGKYLPLIAKFSTELAGEKRPPNYRKLIGEGEAMATKGEEKEEAETVEENQSEPKVEEIEQTKIDEYGRSQEE